MAAPGGNPPNASAEREQKMLEAATEQISMRVQEVKTSVSSLIMKLENDRHLNWPSFLDSYSLISGQLNSLVKNLKNERTPTLKRYITLPLLLSQDRDEELMRVTEQRVPMFNHDLVPDYLRTKPDPEVEAKHQQYETRAASVPPDTAMKNVNVIEKITRETLKHITREKEEIESKASSRAEMDKTSSLEDTLALVGAISMGKGLRDAPQMPVVSRGPMTSMAQQPQMNKPSAAMVKTNIKAQVHPYHRS